ncbi:hypothetical protein ACLB2K_037997 [Fragaria x ananassa]
MVEIIDDPVDPGTQVEKELFQSGDTSLPQTGNAAPVSYPDLATALEILKRDFHSFREQAAKERTEAEAYRVHIAELEKEQFLLRAMLEHRNVYNDSLHHAARVVGTPNPTSSLPSQGQAGSVLPRGPNQIIYVSHPLAHPSFPLPAPQPSPITGDPQMQPKPSNINCGSPNFQFRKHELPPPVLPNHIYRHSPKPHQPIRIGQSHVAFVCYKKKMMRRHVISPISVNSLAR